MQADNADTYVRGPRSFLLARNVIPFLSSCLYKKLQGQVKSVEYLSRRHSVLSPDLFLAFLALHRSVFIGPNKYCEKAMNREIEYPSSSTYLGFRAVSSFVKVSSSLSQINVAPTTPL